MATAALVAVASRVQESYDPGADSAFELALTDLDAASPAEQRQLGDLLAVVAETEVVTRLGERLRAAPWQSMGGSMDPVHSADPAAEPHASAMLNLSALFRCHRERLNRASDMARLREDRAANGQVLQAGAMSPTADCISMPTAPLAPCLVAYGQPQGAHTQPEVHTCTLITKLRSACWGRLVADLDNRAQLLISTSQVLGSDLIGSLTSATGALVAGLHSALTTWHAVAFQWPTC